ncbi:hypothetical protein N825_32660 [Skermanella stibiiresistens SB22]|uniref:Uncharacterized protein n=1 Tax=Skermanella stibiiresistens SB22 TaxID=1385369 RepID=W9GQ18_9PROT|nr:hypothetical protein N825_32660 [Skermanella stibiiresistens SB22]
MDQDLRTSLRRSRALIAQSRAAHDAAREATAHAASLCAESAMVMDEMGFRRSTLPGRARFP